MVTKSKVSGAARYVSLLAFLAFAAYVLYINLEVFYTAHDRSEYLFGTPFLNTLLSRPFGLMQYAGAWLTQLFCKPALGAGVLAALWLLILYVGTKAFKMKRGASMLMILPVACLLVSVVDLGYWIYVSPVRGYWFSQSVGYLLMLALLWVARLTPRHWHLVWYLLGVGLYPVLGWFALLFVLCLALSARPGWRELVGVVLLLFTANLWHALLYPHLKLDAVLMAGFPRFVTASDCSEHLSDPFWVLGAVTALIALGGRYLDRWFVPVSSAVLGIAFTWLLMFHDKGYVDEMRMVRLAETDQWEEVLEVAAGNTKPTTTMVMLKNIALMNEGGLLDRTFKTGNISYPINNPDSLHVSLLDIASPLVYYNYGMNNEAIRLNFENAIQAGFAPFYLKSLARCALAAGDEKLVERYTTQLHHHLFYRDWQPAPVSDLVNELKMCYSDELTGVENSDSYLVNSISLWYQSDSKLASEQALLYSMLRCDSRRFWASMRKYVQLHQNEAFPLHAQEAYIMYLDKAPEEKRMMIPVEQSVYDRYKRFWVTLEGMASPDVKLSEVGERMRAEWGDTYWYYNLFGRKVY